MRAIATVALALVTAPAFAQEGMYVGLALGSFDYEEDVAFLAPDPFGDTASLWRVYGGFEFNEHFGVEVRYSGTEALEQSFSGTDPQLGDFSSTFDVDFTTSSALVIGMLPNDWGALFAGIGYFDMDANADVDLTAECCGGFTDSISVPDDGLIGVLGVEWRFGRFGTGVGLRLEYEWLDVEAADGSTLGIGAAYRF